MKKTNAILMLSVFMFCFSSFLTILAQDNPQTPNAAPTPETELYKFKNECLGSSNQPTCIHSNNTFSLHLDYGNSLDLPQKGARLWNDPWERGRIVSILAHNHLDGNTFYGLKINSTVYLIWPDGNIDNYTINEISFWKNQFNWSIFSPIENSYKLVDHEQLFNNYYRGGVDYEKIVLQTCYENSKGHTEGVIFFVGTKNN